MLRRGWELSRGHFMKLATVGVLATVLPAALPESVGELLIGQFPALSGPMERGTLASAAEALATNDLAMVVIAVSLSLSAALSLIFDDDRFLPRLSAFARDRLVRTVLDGPTFAA